MSEKPTFETDSASMLCNITNIAIGCDLSSAESRESTDPMRRQQALIDAIADWAVVHGNVEGLQTILNNSSQFAGREIEEAQKLIDTAVPLGLLQALNRVKESQKSASQEVKPDTAALAIQTKTLAEVLTPGWIEVG